MGVKNNLAIFVVWDKAKLESFTGRYSIQFAQHITSIFSCYCRDRSYNWDTDLLRNHTSIHIIKARFTSVSIYARRSGSILGYERHWWVIIFSLLASVRQVTGKFPFKNLVSGEIPGWHFAVIQFE